MEKITFMSALLTFYLKGEISQDQDFLNLKIPNTILTFIPLGKRSYNIPVDQIATVDTSFSLDFKHFIFGVLVAFLGLAMIRSSFLVTLIFLAIGASMVLSSFHTILSVHANSGTERAVSFLIFEKSKAEQAAEMINRAIALRHARTDVATQGDRIVDAITAQKK